LIFKTRAISVMTDDCTELAADLSQNFRNKSPFDKSNATSTGLSRYLNTHGILFTMCFPFECTLPFQSTHVAASWINERYGVHAIAGPHIGLVLNPLQAEIRCLYPTDAASNDRDGDGCGPPIMDPEHGSSGASSYNIATRYLVRKALTEYKNFNFGVHTPWDDISCDYFFPGVDLPPAMLAWDVDSKGQVKYQSIVSLLGGEHEAIMGHPVCTCPKNDDHTFGGGQYGFLLHQGSQSWDPIDWQEAMDLQIDFIEHRQDVLWHWNEIVLALPKPQMQDIVQAVFFLDSPDMDDDDRAEGLKKARAVAGVMGGKPYMTMLEYPGEEDILSCPDATLKEDLEMRISMLETHWHKTSVTSSRRGKEVDAIKKGKESLMRSSRRLLR
jgi:hypothetical protein